MNRGTGVRAKVMHPWRGHPCSEESVDPEQCTTYWHLSGDMYADDAGVVYELLHVSPQDPGTFTATGKRITPEVVERALGRAV